MLSLLMIFACQDFGLVDQKYGPDGPQPALEVSPAQVVFTDITPDDGVQTEELTLTNVGAALLTLEDLSIDGDGDWSVLTGPVSTQLAAGESTTVTVAWTPAGTESEAQLLVPSDDPDSPAYVDLIGTALMPELVVWDVSFGEGYVACPVWAEVTVENIGDADATVAALTVDDGWTLDEVALPLTIEAGGLVELGVSWTPAEEGVDEYGVLTATEQTVGDAEGELSGVVIADALRWSPDTVPFDPLYLDCEDDWEVRLYNDSACDVELEALDLPTGVFTISHAALPATIASEGSFKVVVTFVPDERISYAETMTATVDGRDIDVDITGDGMLDTGLESFEVVEPADEPIYAHSSSTLYTWDPSTGSLTTIGSTGVLLLDIAIDSYGQLWGIGSSGTIYQVDTATGAASSFLSTSAYGNGLAVLQDGTLVVTSGYDMSEIDWSTGTTTTLATSTWGSSSGDIVEWDGHLYWTVSGSGGDDLLDYDVSTGALSKLGNTGASGLWGIVAPDGDLYGFSSSGTVYALDSSTGAYTSASSTSTNFYGAAHNPAYGSHPGWSFQLTETPRSYDDIEVEVNGNPTTEFDWDTGTNQILMDDTGLLTGGDIVDVSYGLASECE